MYIFKNVQLWDLMILNLFVVFTYILALHKITFLSHCLLRLNTTNYKLTLVLHRQQMSNVVMLIMCHASYRSIEFSYLPMMCINILKNKADGWAHLHKDNPDAFVLYRLFLMKLSELFIFSDNWYVVSVYWQIKKNQTE